MDPQEGAQLDRDAAAETVAEAPAHAGPPASTKEGAAAEAFFAAADEDAEYACAAAATCNDSTALPGHRPRRSTARQVKQEDEEDYTFSDMEESEPDAGALSDDSDDSCGFYLRRGSSRCGQARRSSARRQALPVETLISGRAKRQRQSRAEDPNMLNTEEAITAALDESADEVPAVRSRLRTAAPASAPAAAPPAASAAVLPAGPAPPAAAVQLPPAVPQEVAATAALGPPPLPLPSMPLPAMAFPPMPLPLPNRPAKGGRGKGRPNKAQQAGMLAIPALPVPFGASALHPLASMLQAAAVQAAQMNAKLMMGPPAMQAAAALQAAAMQAAMQQQAKPATSQHTKANPAAGAAVRPAMPANGSVPAVKVEGLPGLPDLVAAAAGAGGGAAAAANPAQQQQAAAPPPVERRTANTYGEKQAGTSSRPRGSSVDVLYGCAKCRYLRAGCGTCRSREPAFTRRRLRWKPGKGRYQTDVEAPPTFRPTAEEFKDPVAYITRIKPQAEKYGVAHIVPPPGWDPPFALERGTNGLSMESFRFAVRKQFTSHLCCRAAPAPRAPATPPAHSPVPAAAAAGGGGGGMRGAGGGRMGAQGRMSGEGRMGGDLRGGGGGSGACAEGSQHEPAATGQQHVQQQQQEGQTDGSEPMKLSCSDADADGSPAAAAAAHLERGTALPAAGAAVDGGAEAGPPPAADFGFPHIEKKHTLRSFSAYADWAKEVHFSDPLPSQSSTRGGNGGANGGGTRPARSSQRRPRTLPNFGTQPEPSIEQIEAEFWRIVEDPEEVVESLYGQDVDSGHHGSGFPLPLWRRRLLGLHLAKQAAAQGSTAASVELPGYQDDEERRYAEHPWNINNMPRCPSSVLRYLPGLADGELITGVMVPWLYVGSCLSAFCWHVEDHALCSVNYHHMGAPKVWYTVPARATVALEEAVRDALPHLFEANPRLMYQLVTAMSPTELKRRGVPVYRVVHEPGSFIVTMPDSYHSGFNCGFNVAEAVNFAPPSWIPYGSDIALKYRATGKPLTLSHDSLLVTLTQAAEHKAPSISTPAPAPHAAAEQAVQPGGQLAAVEEAADGGEDAAAEQAATQVLAAATAAAADAVQPQQAAAPPAALCDSVAAAVAEGGADAQAGQQRGEEGAASLSPLGPAPLDRVPSEAIALAAGELSLRVEEERRRRMVSFVAVGAMPERRMAVDTPPASTDAAGVHVNTADCDCAHCSCDLWLSSVVSPAAPGICMCPEHAEALVRRYDCPRDSLVLLYRHSPQDLDGMVAQAVARIGGAAEAVAAARLRRPRIESSRVRSVPAGALYAMAEPGHPTGALPTPQEGDDCCASSGGEEDSEDDWQAEPQSGGRHRDRGGSSKRRRSSGGATHGHTRAAVAALGLQTGRMDGKRARSGSAVDATLPPVPAPLSVPSAAAALSPADIAAMFARAQEQPAAAPGQAAAAMPAQQQQPQQPPALLDAPAAPLSASAAVEPAGQAAADAAGAAAAPPVPVEAAAAPDESPAAAGQSGEAAVSAAAGPEAEEKPAAAQRVAAEPEPAAEHAAASVSAQGAQVAEAAVCCEASVPAAHSLPAVEVEPARLNVAEATAEESAASQPAADEPAVHEAALQQQQQAEHEQVAEQQQQYTMPEAAHEQQQAAPEQQQAALPAAPEQQQQQQQQPAAVHGHAVLPAPPPAERSHHPAAAFRDLPSPHRSEYLMPAGAGAETMVCEERDGQAAAVEAVAAEDVLFDVSDLLA